MMVVLKLDCIVENWEEEQPALVISFSLGTDNRATSDFRGSTSRSCRSERASFP